MGKAITIRTARLGKREIRLVEADGVFYGISDKIERIEGDNADDVWRRLHDAVGREDPKFFGYDGAKVRFLKYFPDGFETPLYLKEERNYKLAAMDRFHGSVPLEAAATGTGYGEAVLRAFRDTNLIFRIEKSRIQEAMRGPNADMFIQAAAKFTMDPCQKFLLEMELALMPHSIAKWVVVTYLPYLWNPKIHMFLKPEVTRDFAERVGHRYAKIYQPALKLGVYTSLCDLTKTTGTSISDLSPADNIDIQSYIWTAIEYT